MSPLADYQMPTRTGDVQFVLEDGSTLYSLNVTGDTGLVTVYVNHHVNQALLAALGDAYAWLGCVGGSEYTATSIATVAGVVGAGTPSGLIRIGLDSTDPRVLVLTVEDGLGGEATATLERDGVDRAIFAAGLMVRNL